MHPPTRSLALLGALLLLAPIGTVAQGPSASPSLPPASPSPSAPALDDDQLAELQAMVPPALAGLPLGDHLVLATGEQLATVMSEEEARVLGEALEANGASFADYAAATTYLELSGDDVVVIQAHRFRGVPATDVSQAWVELLTREMTRPEIEQGFIAGRAVTLISDGAVPDRPLLHLFSAEDVTWMMVAADRALVESFIGSLGREAEG